jgi:asparagine synthetase B (glutamine-hydrolysing)
LLEPQFTTRIAEQSDGHLQIEQNGMNMLFGNSVLQLRGSLPTAAPIIEKDSGNIMVWNGEIYNGIEVPRGVNDGQVLFRELCSLPPGDIPFILSKIRGPWAIIFWHAATCTLWFGRDVFGRRSLLKHKPTAACPQFILSSTSPEDCSSNEGFLDVHPGIFNVKLDTGEMSSFSVSSFPWYDGWNIQIAKFERDLDHWQPDDLESMELKCQEVVKQVLQALRKAVAMRCTCIDASTPTQSSEARIMILFSGGVDSTLIAALAHEVLDPEEPIDLVNICFNGGTSPDRLAALDALQELKESFAPTRRWKFIAIDKTIKDIDQSRQHLLQLLSPSDTVMDLNIGAALWFASSGEGILLNNDQNELETGSTTYYRSAARVVLLGHGADEMFGGYGRHRTKFLAGGWEAFGTELALDMKRLWQRNLGRDDRIVADRGREARHPFLDDQLVQVALSWPVQFLADLHQPPGMGDKKVLRECLHHLKLHRAAARVKRAIQFGSRLAQTMNKLQFGGTKRANARSAGSVRLTELEK